MLMACDVKCYWCGHFTGQLLYETERPADVPRYKPSAHNTLPPPQRGEPLRCGRCAGPVYLDEWTSVTVPNLEGFRGRLRRPPQRKLAQAS